MYRTVEIKYKMYEKRDECLNDYRRMGYEYHSTLKVTEEDYTHEVITLKLKE